MRGDLCAVPAFVEESTDINGLSAQKVPIQPSETSRTRKFLQFVHAVCREFDVFFLVWIQGCGSERPGVWMDCDVGMRKGTGMRAAERLKLQRKLDVEMQPFRRAGMELTPTSGLLRAIRTALRIPIEEIAAAMKMNRSGVSDMEARELSNAISIRSLSRMAAAMECKLVYGIVPKHAKTLEALGEERRWRKVFEEKQGTREQGPGTRDQGTGNRE